MGKEGCCVGRSRRRAEVKSVKSSQVNMDGCMARVPRRRGAARAPPPPPPPRGRIQLYRLRYRYQKV